MYKASIHGSIGHGNDRRKRGFLITYPKSKRRTESGTDNSTSKFSLDLDFLNITLVLFHVRITQLSVKSKEYLEVPENSFR